LILTHVFTESFDNLVLLCLAFGSWSCGADCVGHYSHTKARKENIANISRPLDGMHKMQPLDVIFMAPFKHIMHKRLKRG
jgi:hypothetical protein